MMESELIHKIYELVESSPDSALYGLIGVLTGGGITYLSEWWHRRVEQKNINLVDLRKIIFTIKIIDLKLDFIKGLVVKKEKTIAQNILLDFLQIEELLKSLSKNYAFFSKLEDSDLEIYLLECSNVIYHLSVMKRSFEDSFTDVNLSNDDLLQTQIATISEAFKYLPGSCASVSNILEKIKP